jgi:hypothetical protein
MFSIMDLPALADHLGTSRNPFVVAPQHAGTMSSISMVGYLAGISDPAQCAGSSQMLR